MKKVLSKSQMSLIKGGAPTAVAAADYMHDKYGVSQVNCTKY